MRTPLIEQLIRHEGYRRHPYTDTVGKLTVGIGRNLEDKGLSEREAKYLLTNDIDEAWDGLKRSHQVVNMLSVPRQNVLINMTVNMGLEGVGKFKRMWAAIEHTDFADAAVEMLDSRWAVQVGARAVELAVQMEEG